MLKRRKPKFTYTVDTLGGTGLNGCEEMWADSNIHIMNRPVRFRKTPLVPNIMMQAEGGETSILSVVVFSHMYQTEP